ncbi:MAG: HAD-IA family hydrolase [Alphaproteobacteria bacterium]|nr:HAD-IA family hydrolase [Alphaproteobacteria bacterium]
MVQAVLFDLDRTLVDSAGTASAAPQWRNGQGGEKILPFRLGGTVAPHQLPAGLKAQGLRIGIVTSSPQDYASAVLRRFQIPCDALVSYHDSAARKPDPEPLRAVLRSLGTEPGPQSIYVGDEEADIEAARRAGLTSVAVNWGTAVHSLWSSAPDIFIASPEVLLDPDRFAGRGYIGEVLTGKDALDPHWGSVLHCDGAEQVYALGRYFTAFDPRHGASALSAAILALKSDDRPADLLGEILGRAIRHIDWKPDLVVPVPMKPSQSRNRFERLLGVGARHMSPGIELRLHGMRCVEEAGDQRRMEQTEARKFVFATDRIWDGNRILVIDDVYTSGETSMECVRLLKDHGAGEVRVMVLGKTQKTSVGRICPECGRAMMICSRRETLEKFWGCSRYPQCRHVENL